MSGDCSRCCTACRLVHSGAARRCRFCRAPLAELRELVSSARRRRLERRTVTKRGWRWFDVVLAVVAVLGPLQVERRHPSWFVPALIAAVGLWALVRLVVWFFSRYRLVWASGPPRVDAVVFPARARRGDSERGGVARGLGATVDAHLVERRCLAASLLLEPQGEPGRCRLRSARAAEFLVEDGDDVFVVRGEIVLEGPASDEAEAKPAETAAALDTTSLDAIWLDGARLREVLLQNRNRVEVRGGRPREAQVEALRKRGRSSAVLVIEASADAPVTVTVVAKGS